MVIMISVPSSSAVILPTVDNIGFAVFGNHESSSPPASRSFQSVTTHEPTTLGNNLFVYV